ncbi:MAG: hypothetical protein RIA69_06025 [Cyclobacteriaceae bacterium]
MESDISSAWSLLVIGMLTVFVVLTLVVLTGKLLISLVNRFGEDPSSRYGNNQNAISNNEIAAITAAVEAFTGGEGRIQKIEKI